jgi:hypothetical protein
MRHTTYITGTHGSGKFSKALKLSGHSETGLVPNWSGKSSEIGDTCNFATKTLVLHGVNFPEHLASIQFIRDIPWLELYQRNGHCYQLRLEHLIICTTDKIPEDLKYGSFEIIEMSKK